MIKKLRTKYYDTVLLCSFACFILLALFSLITGYLHISIPTINRLVFPLMSIFANLVLWKIIIITLEVCQIKITKQQFVTLLILYICIVGYYLLAVFVPNFLYYWDFSNYLTKQFGLQNDSIKGLLLEL